MSIPNLSNYSIESGKKLTLKLVETGFPLGFSGWIYAEEFSEWRFYIATQLYNVDGPLRTTNLLMGFLDQFGEEVGMDFDDVQIGSSEASYVEGIRRSVGTVLNSCLTIDYSSFADKNGTVHVRGAHLYHSDSSKGREALKAARRKFVSKMSEFCAA